MVPPVPRVKYAIAKLQLSANDAGPICTVIEAAPLSGAAGRMHVERANSGCDKGIATSTCALQTGRDSDVPRKLFHETTGTNIALDAFSTALYSLI